MERDEHDRNMLRLSCSSSQSGRHERGQLCHLLAQRLRQLSVPDKGVPLIGVLCPSVSCTGDALPLSQPEGASLTFISCSRLLEAASFCMSADFVQRLGHGQQAFGDALMHMELSRLQQGLPDQGAPTQELA